MEKTKMDFPRIHHYLPKGYLRGFTNFGFRKKNGKIRVVDFEIGKCFTTAPKQVAAIRDYYTFVNQQGQADYRFETDFLSKLDGDAARIIQTIEQTGNYHLVKIGKL
jgi:hypothetical protein